MLWLTTLFRSSLLVLLKLAANRKCVRAPVGVVRLSQIAPSWMPLLLPSAVVYEKRQVTVSTAAPVLSASPSAVFSYVASNACGDPLRNVVTSLSDLVGPVAADPCRIPEAAPSKSSVGLSAAAD